MAAAAIAEVGFAAALVFSGEPPFIESPSGETLVRARARDVEDDAGAARVAALSDQALIAAPRAAFGKGARPQPENVALASQPAWLDGPRGSGTTP